jgi:hypothetical protein
MGVLSRKIAEWGRSSGGRPPKVRGAAKRGKPDRSFRGNGRFREIGKIAKERIRRVRFNLFGRRPSTKWNGGRKNGGRSRRKFRGSGPVSAGIRFLELRREGRIAVSSIRANDNWIDSISFYQEPPGKVKRKGDAHFDSKMKIAILFQLHK